MSLGQSVVGPDLENEFMALAHISLVEAEIVQTAGAARVFNAQVEALGLLGNIEAGKELLPGALRFGLQPFTGHLNELIAAVPDQQPQLRLLQLPRDGSNPDLDPEIAVAEERYAADGERGCQSVFNPCGIGQHDGIATRCGLVTRGGVVGNHLGVNSREERRGRTDAVGPPLREVGDGNRSAHGVRTHARSEIINQFVGRTLPDLDLRGHAVQRIEIERRRTASPYSRGRDVYLMTAVGGAGRYREPIRLFIDMDDPVDVGRNLEGDIATLIGQAALVRTHARRIDPEGRLLDLDSLHAANDTPANTRNNVRIRFNRSLFIVSLFSIISYSS